MPNTNHLFKQIIAAYQRDIPKFIKDIDTGHPSANTKDRLREVYDVLNLVIQYLIADGAERYGVNIGRISASVVQENVNPAQLAVQHFPASAQLSLSSPTARLSSAPPQTVVAGAPAEEPEPEPDSVMQIITRRNGQRIVIPPRNSRAPRRVFEPGQPVDTNYIIEADASATNTDAEPAI